MKLQGKVIYLLIIGFVCFHTRLFAFQKDSLKTAKVPRHYFRNTFYIDYYGTGKRQLDSINTISRKLKSYRINQTSLCFNIPLFTKDFYKKDSTQISNLHLLLAGEYNKTVVSFDGIKSHSLVKSALAMRGLYNNGKKSIFFIEVTPFTTVDAGYRNTRTFRLAGTVLYNYAYNDYLSLRVGFTRSFVWGNRFNLPYLGLRIGKLDKVNFSFQFPRSASVNVPIGRFVRTSFYMKPQGGLYIFANKDSLQIGDFKDNKKLIFGRNEFLTGFRLDVLPSRHFNFYLSTGITTQNYIAFFAPDERNKNISSYDKYYFQKIDGSLFVNAGLVVRFGKTKSIYNNRQLYNEVDINNSIGIGDNNTNPGNGNIPVLPKKMRKNNTDEVLDLIETQDLY